MIPPKKLVAPALSVGRLIGLLTRNADGSDTVNTDWFADPLARLRATGTRLDQLVDLLYQLLGQPAKNPPEVFKGANWLRISKPGAGASGATPFFVVVPAKGQPTGQLGFGTLLTTTTDKGSFTFHAYVPLANFSAQEAQLLPGQAGAPLQLGLTMTGGPALLSKVQLDATIPLTGADQPTVAVTFTDTSKSEQDPARRKKYTSLAELRQDAAQALLASAVQQANGWLNKPIGKTTVTPGQLLAAAHFLKVLPPGQSNGSQYALSLDQLISVPPQQIALSLLGVALDQLAAAGKLFDKDGVILSAVTTEAPRADAAGQPALATTTYGLNLRLNLPLSPASAEHRPADPAGTAIRLLVGDWLVRETDAENWMTRSGGPAATVPAPGLTVWLLDRHPNNEFVAAPRFSLVSTGLDISGAGDAQLVDLAGYTLQGASLRATLHAPALDAATWQYGFATKLDRLGLPLLPSLESGQGPGTNPVAQSLLQASAPTPAAAEPEAEAGDSDPVNPAFGAVAAWYKGGKFNVQLLDAQGEPSDKVQLPINRALGPLFCRRLGIGWEQDDDNAELALLFDGAVHVGPLTIDLDGLTVGLPAAAPTDLSRYRLDLLGLGVAFEAGQVSLNAALVKVPPTASRKYTQYDGTATIQAGTLGIAALGSYAWLDAVAEQPGYASLFIFGASLQPLGGPGFFFVTGLAAGFGYNRALRLPAPDQVASFPLVQLLSGTEAAPEPTQMLERLSTVVPPERGQYWLAAGVRFTSFDLVHTTALLSVAFGNELKIGVTGVSWLSLPPPKPGGGAPKKCFAYVEMGIAIELLPEEGMLTATAILTPNSFVIDPACRLTGGMAFYTWFGSNPHAGEFVLTVGGYHPDFRPPAYYPRVPRLGFRWPVSDTVTISGDAYFALTPSAIMAGAGLQIIYSSGNLRAWFIAQMDALVQWAPFQYDLRMAVSIGVSYRLNLLFVSVTLKVELGASLLIWGPSMGGQAHVSWSVISFTIGFGADRPARTAILNWHDAEGQGFAQTLLPHPGPAAARRRLPAAGLAPGATPQADASMLTIGQLGGISSTYEEGDATIWVVRPATFRFSALTAFPLTELRTAAPSQAAPGQWRAEGYDSVGVRPMRAIIKESVLTVTLTRHGAKDSDVYDLAGTFDLSLSTELVQAAKWGAPLPLVEGKATPEMNASLPNRLMGFAAAVPKARPLTPAPNAGRWLHIDMATAFKPKELGGAHPLPLSPAAPPVGPLPQAAANAWEQIRESLQSPATVAARTAVHDVLRYQLGLQAGTNGPVKAFGAQPEAWLNGQPLILSTT